MSIVYALVARKRVVLAEHTSSSGNFPTVTRVLLAKIPDSEDGKMSYVYDQYVFHYIVDNGMTFLCMASEETRRRITFGFLDDVMKAWRSRYAAQEGTALAFSLNATFGPILKQKMDQFSVRTSPHFTLLYSTPLYCTVLYSIIIHMLTDPPHTPYHTPFRTTQTVTQ